MVSLRKGIYNSEFNYTEDNGQIEHTLMLKPLKGIHLPALLTVAGKFSGLKETSTSEEVLSKLDKETTKNLVEICTSVVRDSDSNATDEEVDGFVSCHFMELFPVILENNLRSNAKK